MEVSVCVGSSCHLKGAAQVIKRFQAESNNINVREMALEACFCRDMCKEGVIVSINGIIYTKVSPEDVPRLIAENRKRGGLNAESNYN